MAGAFADRVEGSAIEETRAKGQGLARKRRASVLAAAAIVASIFSLLPSLGRSATSIPFVDPSGDSVGAPDITTVVVSSDTAGTITFLISVANQPDLASGSSITVGLDTDRAPETGERVGNLGSDYRILLVGSPRIFTLGRWNGSEYEFSAQATLVAFYSSGRALISVDRSELGGATAFDFVVLGIQAVSGDTITTDPAPDTGAWTYQLVSAAPRLAALTLAFVPQVPKAGKLFAVRMAVVREDAAQPVVTGRVSCRATIDRKPVKAISQAFARGVPTCRWRIPPQAQGKTMRGSITVISQGTRIARTFFVQIG